MSKERLKEMFHELDCIEYGTFELASGGVSNYKVFCDPLFKNEEAREILGKLGYQMFREIEGRKTYEILGVMTGGYEFAKIVAEIAGRNVVGVNPHNNEIKGTIRRRNICYFEDVVTSGGSILKSSEIIRSLHPLIESNKAISIVDREDGGRYNLKRNKIYLKYILTKRELGIKC
jgi:orotate phosphoribosyltransferase